MASGVSGKKRLDERTLGQLNRILRLADNFPQAAEEKDLDGSGLCMGRHPLIVPCGSGGGQWSYDEWSGPRQDIPISSNERRQPLASRAFPP